MNTGTVEYKNQKFNALSVGSVITTYNDPITLLGTLFFIIHLIAYSLLNGFHLPRTTRGNVIVLDLCSSDR